MFRRNISDKLRLFLSTNSALFSNLCRLSLVQCNSYGCLNVRRFWQIIQLYKRLYNERTVCGLLRNFSRRRSTFNKRPKIARGLVPNGALLSASIFSFNMHGIADDEMIEAASSFVDDVSEPSLLNSLTKNLVLSRDELDSWELVSEATDFNLWRRPGAENSGLFEYKCAGRYFDVPAYGFYVAQINLDYRKQWDQLVICLEILETDAETNSDVVRWVTHFPFPMRPREYVYVRRACVDPTSKNLVLTSKNVTHPSCPRDEAKYVRVDNYHSSMVIRAHSGDFYQNGFDYVLTYFDDPKAPFPSIAYNWMISTGVPNFVQKVYTAAKSLGNNGQAIDDTSRKLYNLNVASSSAAQCLTSQKSIMVT